MATKSKTKFTPDIVVNLCDCTNMQDVYSEFAKAKLDKYLTEVELRANINRNIIVIDFENTVTKKPKKVGFFKRIKNWFKCNK